MLKKVEKKAIVDPFKKLAVIRTPIPSSSSSTSSSSSSSSSSAEGSVNNNGNSGIMTRSSSGQALSDQGNNQASTDSHHVSSSTAASKKRLNIPICDVIIDPEYEKYVQPTFQLPTEFVRHIKKIGNEADLSSDYILEDEDLAWIQTNPRLATDKDALKYLNINAFETIIDILEKHTGFANDVIPQSHADKLVMEQLRWPPNVTVRIFPEIYHYWIAKRDRLQKPLCRKFWPQSSASDTNPHHVFRPRDKERYRLRKQQRKNDIEAFRKMQQLRIEMQKARELMQLVLERESLREAEIEIGKEVFERTLYDLDPQSHFGITLPETSYRYKLKFEHLLKSSVAEHSSTSAASSSSSSAPAPAPAPAPASSSSTTAGSSGARLTLVLKNPPKPTVTQPVAPAATVAPPVVPANTTTTPATETTTKREKKDKRGGPGRKKLPTAENVSVDGSATTAPAAPVAPVASTTTAPVKEEEPWSNAGMEWYTADGPLGGSISINHASIFNGGPVVAPIVRVNPALQGPGYVCNPIWPNFMVDIKAREKVVLPRTLSEYIDDLELKTPNPTDDFLPPRGGGMWCSIPGYSEVRNAWANQCAAAQRRLSSDKRTWPDLMDSGTICDDEEDYLNVNRSNNYPTKFRFRGRIGRGGRLVLDRIPIYNDSNAQNVTFFTPSALPAGLASTRPLASLPKLLRAWGHQAASRAVAPAVGDNFTVSFASRSHSGAVASDSGIVDDPLNPSSSGVSQPPIFPITNGTAQAAIPALYPPSRSVLPASLIARELEIYNCSDSEDERVESLARGHPAYPEPAVAKNQIETLAPKYLVHV